MENDFFNLLKQNEINVVENMNIDYIQSYKLANGKIEFKYPSFQLQYTNLNIDELPEEKVYYLKTLFNNFKLVNSLLPLKQESNRIDDIKYPHISIDYKNNIISQKSKRIPFDWRDKDRFESNKKIESTFKQINENYEAYVSIEYRMFKLGISVKSFRVLSLYMNENNKYFHKPCISFYGHLLYFSQCTNYKYPIIPEITNHIASILKESVYDNKKSMFYLYLSYATAEEYMRSLYNLSWSGYDYLIIDPRNENEREFFECDTFLEYVKIIREYERIWAQIHLVNPLEQSKLFTFYGYVFPGEPFEH